MTTEVISAWDVYWVLQLDSIGCFLAAIFFIGLIGSAFVMLFGGLATDFYGDGWGAILKWVKRTVTAALIAGGIGTFLPSSKTAAAMIVLPAIANNETVQTEAADLYKLAKKALSDAVGDDEQEKK